MAYTTIDNPTDYFTTVLTTSTGSALTIDTGFKPDWLWTKARNQARSHELHDTSRGDNKRLKSDATTAEESYSDYLAFTSTGATLGTNHNLGYHAGGTTTGVCWAWKANGGTTTTNDASSTGVGTIDSVYQANTTAGFSIVTYTGTGSAGTIAHGLGVAPTVIIGKDRSDTSQWFVQHPFYGATHYGELDDTTAFADDANYFNDSTPTSTVFGVGSDGATGGTTNYVAYCFAPIQGYSKFGSYTGNGNADGTFVYTGFKPAWIMLKRSSSTGNWLMYNNKMDVDNEALTYLVSNASDAESTAANGIDLLSNGFKIRRTGVSWNNSGDTYVYMAFAEHPFVSSEGVPVTAR